MHDDGGMCMIAFNVFENVFSWNVVGVGVRMTNLADLRVGIRSRFSRAWALWGHDYNSFYRVYIGFSVIYCW